MRLLLSLIRIAWFSYLGLFSWLTPWRYLASKILAPLSQIVFFVLLGSYALTKQPASYYIIGNAVLAVALSGVFGLSWAVQAERVSGMLPYLFGSPASRLLTFGARATFYAIDGLLTGVVGLAVGAAIVGLTVSWGSAATLTLALIAIAFATAALGMLLGSISLVAIDAGFLNNFVYFLMLLSCGVNIPPEEMPLLFSWLSSILPLTRGLSAVRSVFGGPETSSALWLVGAEFLVGAAYFAASYGIFRIIERRARLGATLEAY